MEVSDLERKKIKIWHLRNLYSEFFGVMHLATYFKSFKVKLLVSKLQHIKICLYNLKQRYMYCKSAYNRLYKSKL